MSNWTIIHTSDKNGKFLHSEYLKKYNPDAQIILADLSNNYAPSFAWFNCDLLFRDWLKKHINEIENNNVYVCEYDVLTLTKLPDLELTNALYGSHIIMPHAFDKWQWKSHADLLEEYKIDALAMIVFGWFFCSKNCLEILLDPQYDKLYQKTIISELRFGTILKHNKVKIKEYPVPYVTPYPKFVPKILNENHFYHPVKKPISICYKAISD